jgi:hypothetical protein
MDEPMHGRDWAISRSLNGLITGLNPIANRVFLGSESGQAPQAWSLK